MKRLWLGVVIIVTLLVSAGWWFRRPAMVWYHQHIKHPLKGAVSTKPRPDPERYNLLCSELQRWRADLSLRYKNARTADEREAVENDARILLESTLPSMMRCWLGTPWDFNGTAPKPGAGKIACGYFVSTVLLDAGFDLNRYKLAQQPSANILRTFIPKDNCHLTSNKPYDSFVTDLETFETGIYLVGLDTHVAFLIKEPESFRFIHSSGSRPYCVVDESKDQAKVLQKSKWRMIGNLTATPQALRLWLGGSKIKVHEG